MRMRYLLRRQYMKVSIGSVNAIAIAPHLLCLKLLNVT